MNYAITARKTNKPISKVHYLDYLNKLTDIGAVGNVNFETTRGLHCHFIIKTISKTSFDKFRPTKRGWNVKAVPIYDRKGWIRYCRKDHEENKELNDDPDQQPISEKRMF